MTFKNINIEAFETRHDGPSRQFQHYSYLVTWHDLRLYIPGDAVEDHALTMKNIDIMFLPVWFTGKIKNKELALDAKTLIVFHQKENHEIPPSKNYLVLKQGETIKVEFKEKASFASAEGFESIYAHALRGNIKKVLEILDSLPNENFQFSITAGRMDDHTIVPHKFIQLRNYQWASSNRCGKSWDLLSLKYFTSCSLLFWQRWI